MRRFPLVPKALSQKVFKAKETDQIGFLCLTLRMFVFHKSSQFSHCSKGYVVALKFGFAHSSNLGVHHSDHTSKRALLFKAVRSGGKGKFMTFEYTCCLLQWIFAKMKFLISFST